MKIQFALWSALIAVSVAALGCAGTGAGAHNHNLPPAHRLRGPGPGVDGPGPGVLPPALPPAAAAAGHGPAAHHDVQMLFNRPEGMQVRWDISGVGAFDSEPLILPARKEFPEGGIYRLKLTNIPGREGVELYPTLEVGPISPRTAAYLAHNAIPVEFTEEDFDQALTGNFVTKVIYLPDPEFQELALAGVETLVSTRLDPGVDPIVEADRRGSIMAVVRLGNKDVEMPGAMDDHVIPASYPPENAGEAALGPQPPGGGAPVDGGHARNGQAPMHGYHGPAGDAPIHGHHAPIGNGPIHGHHAPIGNAPAPVSGATLGPGGVTPAYVSGLTGPQYGMPSVGTPIGLPGPPHIPFGAPAGFQKQVLRNKTRMHIPGPVERMNVRMRQRPGFSYPKPPSHMWIREQMIHPSPGFRQPHEDRTHVVH